MKFTKFAAFKKHLIGLGFASHGLDIGLEQFCLGVMNALGPVSHPVTFEWMLENGEKVKVIFVIDMDQTEETLLYEIKEIQMNLRENHFEIVGMAEAAAIMGVTVQYIQTYIKRGVFPEPFQRIAAGPLWYKDQIIAYKKSKE